MFFQIHVWSPLCLVGPELPLGVIRCHHSRCVTGMAAGNTQTTRPRHSCCDCRSLKMSSWVCLHAFIKAIYNQIIMQISESEKENLIKKSDKESLGWFHQIILLLDCEISQDLITQTHVNTSIGLLTNTNVLNWSDLIRGARKSFSACFEGTFQHFST